MSSNQLIRNELWPDDAAPDNVAETQSIGIDPDCGKSLLSKGLFGWEAGIRTPITWSRER